MQVQATMIGLLVGAAALAAGCNGGNGSTEALGSSQARLVLAAKGSSPATLHVTATDDGTAAVVLDKTVEIQGGSATVMDLSLPPASYTLTAGALGGRSASLGSSSAHVTLADDALTQINVDASVAAGGAPAQVQIGVDVAPVIKGIDVQAGSDATVKITVDAGDPSDGTLHFFWSGAGLPGALEGTSSLTLPMAALATLASAGQPVLRVVVQDARGTSADAEVTLSIVNGVIESTTTTVGAAAGACLDAQAQCNAACASDLALGESPNVSIAPCLAQCSLSLASCKES